MPRVSKIVHADGRVRSEFGLRGQIERVVLLRPASLTHHVDSDQRYIELDFLLAPGELAVVGDQILEVSMPARNLAPPGFYMVFVLERNQAGDLIPSVGEHIQLVL